MTRLPTTTSTDEGLKRSIMVSGTLHLLVLLFIIFGLPSFLKPLPVPSMPVPFEVVDISELTNTSVKQPQEAPEPPAPPPKPEEMKAPAPTPPQVQPAPQPPAPPKPQETKPEQIEAILPKPEKKPEPPKKPQEVKPHQDTLASVLKNVEKMKQPPAVKTPDVKQQPAKTQAQAQPVSKAPSLSDRLTMSQEDALRRQVQIHWNVPIGARGVEDMVVHVHITVNPDRSVQNVEVVDKAREATDSYFRAMAESVVRAIYASSPLELPPDKYETWKDIDSNFSAKDML